MISRSYFTLPFQGDLQCLIELLFVGNPLEEKHSADGDWREEVAKRLKNIKKLDGNIAFTSFTTQNTPGFHILNPPVSMSAQVYLRV